MECAAPKCWWKYTTLIPNILKRIRIKSYTVDSFTTFFVHLKKNRFSSSVLYEIFNQNECIKTVSHIFHTASKKNPQSLILHILSTFVKVDCDMLQLCRTCSQRVKDRSGSIERSPHFLINQGPPKFP